MEPQNLYFEGCGREGPIRCIFLCEFHHTAGPKITCQVPENYISKDTFDTVSVYIIPKASLERSTITVTLLGIKILGFPVRINDKKYARNAFYFNLCFVCDSWARTVHYEPVVKKLTDFLVGMEVESSFLSMDDPMGDNVRLTNMLTQVMRDLNSSRMCNLTEGTSTTHLKVVRIATDPAPVYDHQVPIFVQNRKTFLEEQWDLTTHRVLPYIDGFNHVSKIAVEADVENNLVKSCIQNLVYYGVITLIPIFQYSNVYASTPKLRRLCEDPGLRTECIEYVSKSGQKPNFKDVFTFYSSLNRGTTVKDLCIRLNPHVKRINERRLVQFGVLRGLLQRIHRYLIFTGHKDSIPPNNPVYKYLNGSYSDDEICCATGISAQQLEDMVEEDPKLILIWK